VAGGGAGLPWAWGTTPAEDRAAYPADALVGPDARRMTRAVDVAARPETTWRWVCQIAVAPYSYDLLDNLGRRSPRTPTPGAEHVEVGQRMAVVFRVVEVDPPRSWTGLARGWCAVTYAVTPRVGAGGTEASRLVARMSVAAPAPVAHALAWGDLVMMRKQLLTLRDLAGSVGATDGSPVPDSGDGDLPHPR